MANVQPTGEVTVGVDRTGKHYMYEKGKGAGRQPLNLPDEVSRSLTSAGMAPGNPLHLSGAQAQQLQGYKTNVGKGKPVEDLKALGKYFKGQNAWVQRQDDPNQRLDILASEDRMKVLRGPKSKEGQVVSAMVMSTILGREVAYKDVDESKYKLVFNLGTDTRAGYIKIKQGEKELYKIEFKSPKDLSAEEITHFRNTFSSLKAQEHVEEIRSRAASALKTSGLPPEIQSTYHKTLREATEGLSERAAKAIKENTTQFHFYRDLNDLNKAAKSETPLLGFFRLEPSKGVGKGSLNLDSFDRASDTFPTAAHVYAHELFHAVDGLNIETKTGLCFTKSFHDAWRAEAGSISNYAKTAPWEGFAEFGRMVQCGGYSRDELHEKFPKLSAYFDAEGLLSPTLKAKVQRIPTPMPPVFGKPVVEGDVIGDSPRFTATPEQQEALKKGKKVFKHKPRTPKVIRPADPTQPPTPEPNPEMPPKATPKPTGQEPIDKTRVAKHRKAAEPKAPPAPTRDAFGGKAKREHAMNPKNWRKSEGSKRAIPKTLTQEKLDKLVKSISEGRHDYHVMYRPSASTRNDSSGEVPADELNKALHILRGDHPKVHAEKTANANLIRNYNMKWGHAVSLLRRELSKRVK